VTSTPQPLLPAPAPTFVDRWLDRIAADPARARLYAWLAPTLVTLLAAVLRFWNLGHPHELVFDETYYVKDSWSQWALGYPATWPEEADTRFAAGETDIFTDDGSNVVHPPLGRFLIGAGMALFGAESSFGWRFTVALCGTATVLVLYLLARTLTRSTAFATLAAFLLAIDGLAIVMSRITLLDGILTLFVLLAFWFTALDHLDHDRRLAALVAARTSEGGPPRWGPVRWDRPWLFAAGLAAGAACGVKWSGLYVLAALGIYAVVTDALARRRAGVQYWPVDAVVRQGPVSFLLLVPVSAAVYLLSWTGWLTTTGGYSRAAVDAAPAEGFWAWVPLPIQNLWAYHQSTYGFHIGLDSEHGYASPAWQWPLLIRPTSMFWHRDDLGVDGCAATSGCTEAVSSLPNPLLWWAGVAAVVFLAVRFVMTRDWRYALVLTGVAATYVPWLLYPDRTIFQFYTIVMLPFLVLAVVFALRELVGPRGGDPYRRTTGVRLVGVFVAVVVLLSAFWYPVWTAIEVPYDFWRLHNWLLTWV
jgi:dolichyl-phosphate-mannose--protein O-mannosyl transferase